MKRKELRNLAHKIAEAEYLIQHSQDKDEIHYAKELIISLTSQVDDFETLMELDELITDYIAELNQSNL